jgi:hypothetical protein
MIETTVSSLITIKPVLQQLANTEMPARDSFTVLRLLKIIDKEYETIEATQRKMLETHGERDESGNFMPDGYGGVMIKSDSTKAFADEMEQLLKTKVTLEATPLKLEMLDKLKLTPNQLLKMEEFIEM